VIILKKLLLLILSFLPIFFMVSPVAAASNADNPNNVAYYHATSDIHAIPITTNSAFPLYVTGGSDVVMQNGESGNFQQWWWNNSIGYHSVWNQSQNGNCPSNAVLVTNAYPSWGSYLVPGADYCVITNEFTPPPSGLYGWQ
jgi:hypothetical protein